VRNRYVAKAGNLIGKYFRRPNRGSRGGIWPADSSLLLLLVWWQVCHCGDSNCRRHFSKPCASERTANYSCQIFTNFDLESQIKIESRCVAFFRLGAYRLSDVVSHVPPLAPSPLSHHKQQHNLILNHWISPCVSCTQIGWYKKWRPTIRRESGDWRQ